VRCRKKGSQLVEEAAILLLAIILFSTIYTIARPIVHRQREDQQGIFGQIENLWDKSADPGRPAPILIQTDYPKDGRLEGKEEVGNDSDLKRILVGLVGDLADPEFRGIAFEEASRTFFTILPETALGLVHGVEYWKNWASWQSGGPYEGDDPVAGALITAGDYTHGIELAVADYLTFGGVSAVVTYVETRDLPLALSQIFPGQYVQLLAIAVDGTRDKATRAKALGIAIGIAAFIVVVHEFGGPIKEAIGEAFSEAWPKVKGILGRIADKAPEAAKAIFRELKALAIAAKGKLGESRGEELTGKAAELAEELTEIEENPESVAESLREIRECTDGGDPLNLVEFLDETAERSEDLFTRQQVRQNYYDTVSQVAEAEGVERAVEVRDGIERVIELSKEKAGKQWYTGFMEDIAEEVKADVEEAERTIEIIEQALGRDNAGPGRIVKTEDRVRLDIPDSILENLFEQGDIEQGDLVLIDYERSDVRFKTIAKYGEGGVKGFHALLDEEAGEFKGDYGIVTVEKLTDENFMGFWQERSQNLKVTVQSIDGKWYVNMDGKTLEITLEGLGDAGGYVFEEAKVDEYALRYYKDGTVAIAKVEQGEKPTFRKIVNIEYDKVRAEIVLRLQGREETYRIYLNEIIDASQLNPGQINPCEFTVDGVKWNGIEGRWIEDLSPDDLAVVNTEPKDVNAIGEIGERLGRTKVIGIDGGEVLEKPVQMPGTQEKGDLLVQLEGKRILYEFKATTIEDLGVRAQVREGILDITRYMAERTDFTEGRVIVFYLQKDGHVAWYEIVVLKR